MSTGDPKSYPNASSIGPEPEKIPHQSFAQVEDVTGPRLNDENSQFDLDSGNHSRRSQEIDLERASRM